MERKLETDNWQTWTEAMELLLSARILWNTIGGSFSSPNPSARPKDNQDENSTIHRHTCGILSMVYGCNRPISRNTKTSQIAWEALRKLHGVEHQERINLQKRCDPKSQCRKRFWCMHCSLSLGTPPEARRKVRKSNLSLRF